MSVIWSFTAAVLMTIKEIKSRVSQSDAKDQSHIPKDGFVLSETFCMSAYFCGI